MRLYATYANCQTLHRKLIPDGVFSYPIITIFCRTKRLTMKVVLSCQILKQAQEKKILHKKLINKVISYAQANEKVKKRKNKFHYWNTLEIFQTRQKR